MPAKKRRPSGSCVSPWKYSSGTACASASRQRPGSFARGRSADQRKRPVPPRRPPASPGLAGQRLADALGEHEPDVLVDDLKLLHRARATGPEERDQPLHELLGCAGP